MENIQEYMQILELLNIIILISVTVLSTFMFFLYKNISFIILVLTHSMEKFGNRNEYLLHKLSIIKFNK